jgi:hypothetical protein
LAVDVARDVDGGVHAHDVGLLGEDAFHHVAERTHGGLSDGLALQGRLIPGGNVHQIKLNKYR